MVGAPAYEVFERLVGIPIATRFAQANDALQLHFRYVGPVRKASHRSCLHARIALRAHRFHDGRIGHLPGGNFRFRLCTGSVRIGSGCPLRRRNAQWRRGGTFDGDRR